MNTYTVLETFLITALKTSIQYVLVSFLFFLPLWVLKIEKIQRRKIQTRSPTKKVMMREIRLSLNSCLVFAAVGTFAITAREQHWSLEYGDMEKYGIAYFCLSLYLMFAVHDIWHYAVHRLCHEVPFFFKHVHKTHHSFSTPTPWSADAFHPLDALVNISFIPLLVFLFPLHTSAIATYLWFVVFINILGHCGYELMPHGLTRHWLFKYLNTATGHDIHHQKVHFNFGLYTNILDRMFGTWHPSTEVIYENATRPKPSPSGEGIGTAKLDESTV